MEKSQSQLDLEVAQATGESVSTIAEFGFVELTPFPCEPERNPQMVDWDAVDQQRTSQLASV